MKWHLPDDAAIIAASIVDVFDPENVPRSSMIACDYCIAQNISKNVIAFHGMDDWLRRICNSQLLMCQPILERDYSPTRVGHTPRCWCHSWRTGWRPEHFKHDIAHMRLSMVRSQDIRILQTSDKAWNWSSRQLTYRPNSCFVLWKRQYP